jgi:hypothetical protein
MQTRESHSALATSHRQQRDAAIMTTTSTASTPAWTANAVRQLGLTTDVATAGAVLGIGRTKAYELAKSGEFPVPLLRVGRRYLVPTQGTLSFLGAQ